MKTYSFTDLSDIAKEVARRWWNEGNYYEIEAMMITEDMNYILSEEYDFTSQDKSSVDWSLSNTQGDYVGLNGRFTLKKLHTLVMEHLTEKEKKWYKILAIDSEKIYFSHSVNYHDYYGQQVDFNVDVSFDIDSYPHIVNLYDKIVEVAPKAIKKKVDEIRAKLKTIGYNQFEYYRSDEYVDDCLISNKYEFTKDGEHFE